MTNDREEINKRDEELPGYKSNPPSEDIFNKLELDDNVDPDNPFAPKDPLERDTNQFSEDLTLGDLDVPGSELDDSMELIGNEDEENNYNSLGSDDNSALEDDSSKSDYTI